jgi:MFS family permease
MADTSELNDASASIAERNLIPTPAPAQVERAIRLSYVQQMLVAVFAASTGGMFLIGFAIDLGANNLVLGLLSTIPQFFVVFQFISALLVERGVSRKKLTVGFAFVQPLCWFLIAAIPFLGSRLDRHTQFTILIGVLALVALSGHFAGNARASWVGELIPAERRGSFFGYCAMFAGIVGAVFAIVEGRFLDVVRTKGVAAFASLFFFGSLFGLATAALHIPQPDCPLPNRSARPSFGALVRDTVRNRLFVSLALVHMVLALTGIAGPFFPAYQLRDVGMSFFGLGLLNAVVTAATLLTSPFWGKCVDRFGGKPILIVGLLLVAPLSLVWLAIPPKAVFQAYCLLPFTNFIAGCAVAAISVSITTLMYKTSKAEGRSVQFALYSGFVTLAAAPMPFLGGWLISALNNTGYALDLRLLFLGSSLFMFAAAWFARKIQEPQSVDVRTFVLEVSGRAPSWFRVITPLIFTPILGPKNRKSPTKNQSGTRQV